MRLPNDEPERLLELRELQVLDKVSTPGLEALVQLASESFEIPVVLVSLVDANRQWFMACLGLGVSETPREYAFCHHALFSETPLVIEDATKDERFVDNPLVTGEPHIRFYAGAPLIMPTGRILGTFCIIDQRPRSLSDIEVSRLRMFATAARDIIASLSPTVDRDGTEEDGELRYLARLVHDFRTPIGNMMGFAELIQNEAHGPLGAPEYIDYMKMIRQSGSHALDLIDGILSIEKTKSRTNGQLEQFSLTDLVKTVAAAFEGQAKGRDQEISVEAPAKDVLCYVDSLAAHRVMNNIISNACKYAGNSARIKIALSDTMPGTDFHLAITDDGPGLPASILARIGEPFVSEGKKGSSGLGLSNILKLATSMGCVCKITNQESGGVCATFYKPSQ